MWSKTEQNTCYLTEGLCRTRFHKNFVKILTSDLAQKHQPGVFWGILFLKFQWTPTKMTIYIGVFKGVLMQIWKSVNIFVFIWKWYVDDFTLKHLLLFEICARKICKKFVYKLLKQQNMLKISLLFRKFTNFTGK